MVTYTAPYKEIFKGDNKHINWKLTMNKVAYDLTNVVEIKFTVLEEDAEGASQIFQCTLSDTDIVKVVAIDGTIYADVIPVDTNTTTAGEKIYDIEVEDETNQIITFGKGIFNIKQDCS